MQDSFRPIRRLLEYQCRETQVRPFTAFRPPGWLVREARERAELPANPSTNRRTGDLETSNRVERGWLRSPLLCRATAPSGRRRHSLRTRPEGCGTKSLVSRVYPCAARMNLIRQGEAGPGDPRGPGVRPTVWPVLRKVCGTRLDSLRHIFVPHPGLRHHPQSSLPGLPCEGMCGFGGRG
jgi:hypothetical protein